jgi:hypothetical protein
MTDQNVYPDLTFSQRVEDQTKIFINTQLQDEYKFNTALLNVKDISNFFKNELSKYNQKHTKCKRINYALIAGETMLSTAGVGTGIALTLTGIGATVGIPIVGGSVVVGSITMKLIDFILENNRRRYGRLVLLCKTTLIEFESLFDESMKDHKIDEKEYKKLKAKYDFYVENKNKIKVETEITKQKLLGSINQHPNIETIEKLLLDLKQSVGMSSNVEQNQIPKK